MRRAWFEGRERRTWPGYKGSVGPKGELGVRGPAGPKGEHGLTGAHAWPPWV